jgi:hypothetical protein
MKHVKLIIIISLTIFLSTLATLGTYAYLTNESSTGVVYFTLGSVKLQADNLPWKYVPVNIKGVEITSNDLLNGQKLSTDLQVNSLRPGDAFEKNVTVIYTGSLESKLKICTGNLLIESPYTLNIDLIDKSSGVTVSKDENDCNILYVGNLKQNNCLKFKVRLEVPVQYTEKQGKNTNIDLNNNAFKLLDITATQWNNPTFSEQ